MLHFQSGSSKYFLMSFFWLTGYSEMCYLNVQVTGNFPEISVSLNFNLIMFNQRTYFRWHEFFEINRLILWLSIRPILVDVPCALAKSKVEFKKGQLCPISTSCPIGLENFLPIFLPICKKGVLKSPVVNVEIFIFFFPFYQDLLHIFWNSYTSMRFMHLSSWSTDSFINRKIPLFLWFSGCFWRY